MKDKKDIDKLLYSINNQFGKGSAQRLSDKPEKFESISSGSLKIDKALGGGFPKGRIIEIFGPEASGKTGVALNTVAEVQKIGGVAAIVDVENALTPEYAEKCGVDIPNLIISQPDNAEQALEITREYIKSGLIDIIVIDSVAALTPKSEIEGEVGESKMGLQARIMSQALRIMTKEVSKTNCIVIFINQLRQKIGVMFGNPETTPGGNALKFYSSVRVDVRRSLKTENGEKIGFNQKITIIKNKMAPAFKKCERFIKFDSGIDKVQEMFELSLEFNIFTRKGSWYYYEDVKLGQGSDFVVDLLKDNIELQEEILEKILKNF